jgi:hypothetical protein
MHNKKAPAQSAAVERANLSGKTFLHFQPLRAGGHNVRSGRVVGALGPDHWLLAFAGSCRFSNVFSAAQLESFVFCDSDEDASAFVASLNAGPLTSPMGRGMPSGGA